MFTPKWKKALERRYIRATAEAAKVARFCFECHTDTWKALCSVGEIGFDEIAPERVKNAGEGIVSVNLTGMELLRFLEARYDTAMATGADGRELRQAMYGNAVRGAEVVVHGLYHEMVTLLLSNTDAASVSPLSFTRVVDMPVNTATP